VSKLVTKPAAAPFAAGELAPHISLLDTHAHVHFSNYVGQVDAVLQRARAAGVAGVITVGVNTADSKRAVELAATYESVWATVGIHPHDADEAEQGIDYIKELAGRRKVVAVGECGLDLYKSQTTLEQQEQALRAQIEVALERDLPLVFHVREAFEPFFKILRDYSNVRGVVHCFSGGRTEMEQAVEMGLHVALNGIMTFTKEAAQLEAGRVVPADRLLLETDCPFLSPVPYRGKTNEPARVADIAAFVAELRGQSLVEIARQTTANATALFKLDLR
jgi:TatD DNase family protein